MKVLWSHVGILAVTAFLIVFIYIKRIELVNISSFCPAQNQTVIRRMMAPPPLPSYREAAPRSQHQDFLSYFARKDVERVNMLVSVNVSKLSDKEAKLRLHRVVSEPVQGVCRSLKRIGGRWLGGYRAIDGDKFICMDNQEIWDKSGSCLIYSFGISNSLGISDKQVQKQNSKTLNLDTLENIIKTNNHKNTQIHYLKVDVEGAELASIPNWIQTGALANVQQIAMELHLHNSDGNGYRKLLKSLQDLYKLGFRFISYEINHAMGRTGEYFNFFEVVLMKA